MRKILFIINPVAGRGKSKDYISLIKKRMTIEAIDFEIKISNQVGHVTKLAKWACEHQFSDIIVVGGDGTLVECINGLDLSQSVNVGIIPAGSGNDYARMLNMSSDFEIAMNHILIGQYKLVDIGLANGERFINACCLGIDSAIIMDTDKIKAYLKGSTAYLLSTMKQFFFYQSQKVNIKIDEMVLERKVILVAISKGQYIGGGMQISPHACIDDGEFSICIVNHINRFKLMKLFPSIFKGKHIEYKTYVETYKGKNVKIESLNDNLWYELDGNLRGMTPLITELSENKIRMIYSS